MKTYYIENGSEYATIVQTNHSLHEVSQLLERGRYKMIECNSASIAQAKLTDSGKEYTDISSWYK